MCDIGNIRSPSSGSRAATGGRGPAFIGGTAMRSPAPPAGPPVRPSPGALFERSRRHRRLPPHLTVTGPTVLPGSMARYKFNFQIFSLPMATTVATRLDSFGERVRRLCLGTIFEISPVLHLLLSIWGFLYTSECEFFCLWIEK